MIKQKFPLGLHWPTIEPFLFCAHHRDHYPAGNAEFGVSPNLLAGRDLGQDFELKDGFRMYHGESVPGFPVHPHRGFETITVVRQGFADHADSMGAAGRYGQGDVQWMTAGRGVQHSEMFPLINKNGKNTLELFQIWLNLPKADKMSAPDFKMFWHEKIPVYQSGGAQVTVIAGQLFDAIAMQPPKASWAAKPESDVAVWLIKLAPNAQLALPPAKNGTIRNLYFYEGSDLVIDQTSVKSGFGYYVDAETELQLRTNETAAEILLLQGRPIGEPILQHGPFVMTSKEEIIQTFRDYERTQFGGWPWPRLDMIHGEKAERFAKYPDGRVERP